jgi:hypothetical protein
LRLEITTVAPCSAIRVAIARPMPLVDPVTMATFPVRSNSDDIFLPLKLSIFSARIAAACSVRVAATVFSARVAANLPRGLPRRYR